MLKATVKTLSLTAALALSAAGVWAQTNATPSSGGTTPPVAPSPSGNSPAPQVSNQQGAMTSGAGGSGMGTSNATGSSAGTTGNSSSMGSSSTSGTSGTMSGSDTGMNNNQQTGMNGNNGRMRNRAARADRN